MTPKFFQQLAIKVGDERSTEKYWRTMSEDEKAAVREDFRGLDIRYLKEYYALDQMTRYFEAAYSKLSPTQRMQVAEEITKITES